MITAKKILGKLKREDVPDVQFGRRYRERISGYEGIAVGFTSYISGCDQVCLRPTELDEKGNFRAGQWFDDALLIDVEAERAVVRTSERGPELEAPTK